MAKTNKKAIDVAGLEDANKSLNNLKNQQQKSTNTLAEVIENAIKDVTTLNNVDPKDFYEGNTSSKFDEVREEKILNGLDVISKMEISGIKINPLLILLSRFWEIKPIRSVVKDHIYAEAEANGYEGSDYLQNVLGEEIDAFAEIQTTIDRIKYARTYYKPREGREAKGKTIIVNIDGAQYEIGEKQLQALRANHKDAAELKAKVLEVAKKSEVLEL